MLLAECAGSCEHCIGTVSSESGRLLLYCSGTANMPLFFCEKHLFVFVQVSAKDNVKVIPIGLFSHSAVTPKAFI